MSLVYNGYMGPVIGRLGPAVGYLWRGRPVFRAYVRHIHYPNTPQQQAERQWFVAMVRFAAEARSALLQGLNEPALRQGMTEGNWFVRSNKQHFHSSPKLGEGDPQGGGVCHNSPDQITVDYPRLALSEGPVAPVTPTAVEIADDGILTVDFNKNSHLRHARAIDSVHLYLYNATLRRGLHAAPVRRCAGRVALRLPDGWQQHDLHCYLFVTDTRSLASPTTYISPATPQAPNLPEPQPDTTPSSHSHTPTTHTPQPLTTNTQPNPYPRGKP